MARKLKLRVSHVFIHREPDGGFLRVLTGCEFSGELIEAIWLRFPYLRQS